MDDNKNSSERCVLCLDQKRSPVLIQCGHSFCTGCLDVYKSYKKYPWANKCPICRDVLKEKKRTTKRKYSDANVNAETQNTRITPIIDTETNSSSTANPSTMSQQINIFEEFMALAFDVYENVDDSVQDLTEIDDTYYHGEHEHESETDLDFGDSYHDELNYYTDSDDYNDAQDDDDNDQDYYYFEEDDDDDSYQPPRTRRHVDGFYSENAFNDDHDENSIINVDDSVSYEVDSLIPRDWNNNFNSDIDWETVIASDVIIID